MSYRMAQLAERFACHWGETGSTTQAEIPPELRPLIRGTTDRALGLQQYLWGGGAPNQYYLGGDTGGGGGTSTDTGDAVQPAAREGGTRTRRPSGRHASTDAQSLTAANKAATGPTRRQFDFDPGDRWWETGAAAQYGMQPGKAYEWDAATNSVALASDPRFGDAAFSGLAGQPVSGYGGPHISENIARELRTQGVEGLEHATWRPGYRSHTFPHSQYAGYGGADPAGFGSAAAKSQTAKSQTEGGGTTATAKSTDFNAEDFDWNDFLRQIMSGGLGNLGEETKQPDAWGPMGEGTREGTPSGTGFPPGFIGEGGGGYPAGQTPGSALTPGFNQFQMSPMGIAGPNVRPVPGAAPLQEAAAEAVPWAGSPTGAETDAYKWINQMPGVSALKVSGRDIMRDPGMKAAFDRFQTFEQPMIQNRASLQGLGRSSATTDKLSLGLSNMMLPQIQAAQQREENRLNRMTGAWGEAGRLSTGLAGLGTQRRMGAVDQAMRVGGEGRRIAGEQAGAPYQDFLRRAALGENVLMGPLGGMVPSTIGSSTSTSGKF